jgi:hypothetical protein
MTIDNRTDAERRYDATRDGTLYFQPQPADEPENTDLLIAILEQIEAGEDADYEPWDAILDEITRPAA